MLFSFGNIMLDCVSNSLSRACGTDMARQKPIIVVQTTVQSTIQWRFFQDQASGRWIAICDPLRLTIEADSNAELRENIEDALQLFMRSLLKSGELERFLRDHGWQQRVVGNIVRNDDVRFDVPIELIAHRANDPARHVH